VLNKKDRYLAAAQKHLERGHPERALAELARVVEEDPRDTRTWLKMAEIHARAGALEQARDIYLRTAEIYLSQGLLQKAATVYKSVCKLAPAARGATPSVPQVRQRLADIYRELGMVGESLRELELAVDELRAAGRAPDALPALRKIVGLHPDNVVARIKLAETASEVGGREEAIQELREAAAQLKRQGRADEHVRVAERLLFFCPEDFAVARELAAIYIGRRNARLALVKLQGPLKAAPRDPENVALLAEALAQLDPAKAISVWRELAELHDEAGRNAERDAAVRAALALDPTDGETREMAARWGIATVSALRSVRSARLTPTPPPLPLATMSAATASASATLSAVGVGHLEGVARILAEADVFVKYGLTDRAVEHLRRVFTIEPHHRGARERLAGVLAQLGRRAEAAAELAVLAAELKAENATDAALVAERALTLDPSCAAAAELLGRAPGGPVAPAAASAHELLAELEQVDFFVQQSLYDEARAVLDEIAERFPGSPLIAERRRILDADADRAKDDDDVVLPTVSSSDARAAEEELQLGAVPVGGDEPAAGQGPMAKLSVSELADPATHGDLGIAYKQMGLYDAAIAEFRQLAVDQRRAVFALTMVGECVEAKGELGEAVARYKEALNLPQVTLQESLELYYLLGGVFERLGDIREALYFFENVGKREPSFRDVRDRIAALRPPSARQA
jgi:tetratricopeptide (TPR) repeat protein